MSRRCFTRLFARGAFAALIFVLSAVLVAPSWAQTEESMPPRTSWGDPDIGGIWNNSTLTPLERPEDQADKEFLSPDEAGALERQVVERNNRANEPQRRPYRAAARRRECGRVQQLLDGARDEKPSPRGARR